MTYLTVKQPMPISTPTEVVLSVEFVRSVSCWFSGNSSSAECLLGFDDQVSSVDGFNLYPRETYFFYLPAGRSLWVVGSGPGTFHALIGGAP